MQHMSQISYKSNKIKDLRTELVSILNQLHPSEAISLVESIGKELRKKNSIRIMSNQPVKNIDSERPDLMTIKRKNERRNSK